MTETKTPVIAPVMDSAITVIPASAKKPSDRKPTKKKKKETRPAIPDNVDSFNVTYKGYEYAINGAAIDAEFIFLLAQEDLGGMVKATEKLIGPLQRQQYFVRSRAENLTGVETFEDLGEFMQVIVAAASEKFTGDSGN